MMPKKLISAHDFQEVIRTGYADFYHFRKDGQGNLIIYNIQVREKIVIENVVPNTRIIISKNTSFEEFHIKGGEFESFTIEGGEFNGRFLISEGVFKKYLRILGGTFKKSLQISGGQFQKGLYIQGGDFFDIVRISGGSFKFSPRISGGLFYSEVRIENGVFEDRFLISGGEFMQDFDILGGQFKFMFEITGGKFKNFVNIVRGEFKHFNIEGGKFNRTLQIVGGKFTNSFKFQKGEYNCPICISNGEFHMFEISSGTFHNTVSILGGKFKSFFISGGEFKLDFGLEGGEFADIYIESGKFNSSFNVHGGGCLKSFNIVNEAQIHELVLYKNSIGNHIVNGAYIDEISFYNYQNLHSLKLMGVQSCKKGSDVKVTIYRSSLGNTEIIGCDWSKGTLTVDDSKIIDCFYTDTIFPTDIKSAEKNTIANVKQVRDTYSQLKTIADKQNDRQSSLSFQAKSNEQILLLKKEELQRTIKWKFFWGIAFWKQDWWEWLQLWLSKISNNFGTSYLRALFMMLLVGFISFSIYLPCLDGNLEFTWNITDWGTGFWYSATHHFGEFFGFLNPARKYNFLVCTGSNCHEQLALLVDWISRIFIGFFLFGLIQAFRKYGKK